MNDDASSKISGDDIFAIKITESMEIRNALRKGLFEAQGKEPDKIPLYVSWPSWLEDGIVCIFASDLHNLLRKTVRDSAVSFAGLIGDPAEILPDIAQGSVKELTEVHQGEKTGKDLIEKISGIKADDVLTAKEELNNASAEKKIHEDTDETVESDTEAQKKMEPNKSQSFTDRLFKQIIPDDSQDSPEEPVK